MHKKNKEKTNLRWYRSHGFKCIHVNNGIYNTHEMIYTYVTHSEIPLGETHIRLVTDVLVDVHDHS